MQYVIIEQEYFQVDTIEHVAAILAIMEELGLECLDIWFTECNMPYIVANGDPNSYHVGELRISPQRDFLVVNC